MKIGVDMDGVIADFTSSALRNVKKEWGIDLAYEDVINHRMNDTVFSHMDTEQKLRWEYRKRDMYRHICPPGFFGQLDPYEGTIETLKVLHKLHDVVIITKPLEWTFCPEEKYTWLNKQLGFKPNVILVNSMEAKGLIDVDVMVDDDPRVLKSLSSAVGIAVERPWNKEFLKWEPFKTVSSFNEVPDMLHEISQSLYSTDIY